LALRSRKKRTLLALRSRKKRKLLALRSRKKRKLLALRSRKKRTLLALRSPKRTLVGAPPARSSLLSLAHAAEPRSHGTQLRVLGRAAEPEAQVAEDHEGQVRAR
jgi:hypothetical protein